jgi:hypothetical protein
VFSSLDTEWRKVLALSTRVIFRFWCTRRPKAESVRRLRFLSKMAQDQGCLLARHPFLATSSYSEYESAIVVSGDS